ncbi:BRMS1 transcriptional repressor [Carabus blaptoides fortunei]
MSPMKVPNSNGGDESEGDVSGVESDHSGSSHDGDGARDSSEGDEEADSDDSSEMDESECEMRRNECMEILADLERQSNVIREQLYREKVSQVENQLVEVKNGRSQEYIGRLQTLQDNMKIRTEVAGILRNYRLANINNKFDAEEQAAKQNFDSEKHLAFDWLHSELMDKIRRLEEDRQNVELNWSEVGDWSSRSRSRNNGPRRKAVTVSGPYIVYMLNQQDILEDWSLIRKALKRSPT